MQLQTIKTKDYWLLVDTKPSGYKNTEWCYGEPNNDIELYQFTYDIEKYPTGNKVIGHLPIGNAPILDHVALLPELPKQEEDVDHLSLKYNPKDILETSKGCFDDINESDRNIWKSGYKAASNKRYSDEDLKKSILAFYRVSCNGEFDDGGDFEEDEFNKWFNDYTQSLSPIQDNWEFIPEYESYDPINSQTKKGKHIDETYVGFETTSNPEGGPDLIIGKWIRK